MEAPRPGGGGFERERNIGSLVCERSVFHEFDGQPRLSRIRLGELTVERGSRHAERPEHAPVYQGFVTDAAAVAEGIVFASSGVLAEKAHGASVLETASDDFARKGAGIEITLAVQDFRILAKGQS